MTPAELAEHLKGVPPFHLSLITLAWELVGPDGSVDTKQIRFRMREVLVAKNEAAAYVQATHLMTEALKRCATVTDR